METTQSFRLAGGTDIEEISCDHVNDQTIIYWDDIEQVFPGVRHIKNGNATIKLLRDSNENRVVPHRIKHHPGVVLDVVISTPVQPTSTLNTDTTSTSTTDHITENLQITQPPAYTSIDEDRVFTPSITSTLPSTSPLPNLQRDSVSTLSFNQYMTLARKASKESRVEQELVSSLPSDVQAQVRGSENVRDSLVQAIKDGLVDRPNEQLVSCLQELNDRMMESRHLASGIVDLVSKINELESKNNELVRKSNQVASENEGLLARVDELQDVLDSKQEEMWQLQVQGLDRLSLLQGNVTTLLTRSYEVYEHPIPRLFIVLPEDRSSSNTQDRHSVKFRLYFLCECGEHTKSSNSKISHHIHLAKHEGYDISRPDVFFQHYGSYVLTVLNMLKFRISAAGVSVPSVSLLIRDDAVDDKMIMGLKVRIGNIQSAMDRAIEYIEKITLDEVQDVKGSSEKDGGKDSFEDADLAQLETFLKIQSGDKATGNMFRTVNGKGQVKWICIDHYREIRQEKETMALRNIVNSLKGVFDETIGRVEVELHLRAKEFYSVLEKTKAVQELKISIGKETNQNDYKRMRDAVTKTSVRVIHIDLYDRFITPSLLNRNQEYDPLLDIMKHPSIQSFTYIGPYDFVKRSSLVSRNDDFSNLRHLQLPLYCPEGETLGPRGVLGYKSLIANAPNLSSLTIPIDGRNVLQVYNAIAEYQTYPILIMVCSAYHPMNLYIPPLKRKDQPITTQEYMTHILRIWMELDPSDIRTLYINRYQEATVYNSPKIDGVSRRVCLTSADQLGDAISRSIASIVAQTQLACLDLDMEDEPGRICILEVIPWVHMRYLGVRPKPSSVTDVMMVLVDGISRMPGKVDLESFYLISYLESGPETPFTSLQQDLLHTLLTPMTLQCLHLQVVLTLEQILTLFKMIDVSQLKSVVLWAKGFDSVKVDTIIDALQRATKLGGLVLLRANITQEQIDRMDKERKCLNNNGLGKPIFSKRRFL